MKKGRNHKPHSDRASFAVQSDSASILQAQQQLSQGGKDSKMRVLSSHRQPSNNLSNQRYASKTIGEGESQRPKQQQSNAFVRPLLQKGKGDRRADLRNQSMDLHNNVLQVTIKDSLDNTPYIRALHEQLSYLRQKIQILESEQNSKMFKRTIPFDQFPSYPTNEMSKTIEPRRSLCGKIYFRGQTPNSEERPYKYNSKVQEGTNYKQGSTNSDRQFSDMEGFTKSAIPKNPEDVSKLKYRVKSSGLRKRKESQQQQRVNDVVEMKEVIVSEQLKPVFVENKGWEITDIKDDFRQKISNKLQIPSIFPLEPPKVGEKISEYQKLAEHIYNNFKIDVNKCKEKPIVRNFKNGVYFQLKPNKNVVWYFNGAFYFGDWETDLPSQGEKNGFGFEYIPNKYYYLGQFKKGMRNGKGCIKIINEKDPTSTEFTAYDGEWLNGKPHGLGKHIDEKGNKYIGEFESGQKTGKAVILSRDGLHYQGQVKSGLKHGYGVEKLVNGDTYMGQFRQGKFQGHGVYKWKNQSVYEGSFEKGKRQGKGKWKSYNGDYFQGEYVNDIKNGWGKFIWANGQVYEGQFRNDLRHGEGTYKHPKGKMGKFMWIDGQIDHRLYSREQEVYRLRNINKQEQQ